jgi:ankyrin repeat protein
MRRGLHVNVLAALGLTTALWTAAPDAPVADAAMRGDQAAVRTLLQGGADPNAAQGDGMTALHWAGERGDVALTQLLLYSGARVDPVTRIGDLTPLHLASKGGHAPVVQALLEAGADANAATGTGGATALHFAAAAGSAPAVTALLDRGADVNAREASWGQTPLMFAAAANRVAAVKVLMERGADAAITAKVVDLPSLVAVDGAAKRRQRQVLAALRGDGNARPTPSQIEASMEAAEEVQRNNLKVEAGPGGGDADDEGVAGYPEQVGTQGGMTALLYAVRQGHVEAALALLDAGADINQRKAGDNASPLLVATLNGHYDLALQLLGRGADPNLAGQAGATPLFAVINLQWAPQSRYPQPRDQDQQKATYLEVMEAFLKAGADPNARLTQHLWVVFYNYDRIHVDFSGATPFWRAAYGTDVDAMRLLVKYGADPNIPTLKPAGGRGGGNRADPSGLPPVPDGGPGVFPIHAASGVSYGQGAGNAHRHAPDGWLPAVKYLVEEHGAHVNERDLNGYTAVHNAASRGDDDMIRYLVSKGADVTVVSRRGQTTADMANGPAQRINPFPATIALLESLGSKNNHRCVGC